MGTARSRALLGIAVLLALMSAVVVVAALRARNDRNARDAVSQREGVVAAMEEARSQLAREATSATAALGSQDPSSFVNDYQQAQAAADEALGQAQSALTEIDNSDAAAALEMFSLSLGYLRQDIDTALGSAAGSQHTPVPAGDEYFALLQPRLDQALIELDRLVAAQKVQLATQREEANRASNVTLALLVSWSAIALLVGSAVVMAIIVSVTRPIAALRLRVSEAASGDGAASAGVSGPEEVTALARDFDRMAEQRRSAEKAQRASDEKYQALFQRSMDAVYLHDLDGRFIDGNAATLELLGCTREELLSSSVVDFFEEPRRPAVLAAMNDLIDGSSRGDIRTFRLKRRDGLTADVEVAGSMVRTEDGATVVMGVARDVSYRVRAEEVLRGSEDKYREIFERVQDIFYSTDAQGIITDISPAVRRWGYTPEEMIGTQVLNVYPDPKERQGLLSELMARGEVTDYEVKLRAADGSVKYSSVGSHLIRGPDGEMLGVEGVLRDITDRKRAEEALREQMRRDPLTGVLNHAAVVSELRDLISRSTNGERCAVLMSDVDSLKAINDTFGHPVGDSVLVGVARSLSRDGALVGRYGGDEFIAVLPGAGRPEAERYKNDVLEAVNQMGLQDPQSGAGVPVFVSSGIAICPIEANRIEELVQLADSGMYAEKRLRRESSSGLLAVRHRGGDVDAARIVGEIVPYLTTTGNLEEKLRLVARRLSVAAGYDAVSFMLFDADPDAPPSMVTFARGPEKLLNKWNSEEVKITTTGRNVKSEPWHQRPRIMREVEQNPRFSDTQRELLRKAGLKSAMTAPMLWRNEPIGILAVASERENAFTPHDAQVLSAVATQVTAIVSLETLVEELRAASGRLSQAHTETVMLLAAAAEAHDRTTGKHLRNVRTISEQLARELGYGDEDARELGLAAVLHDMGKIRVTDSVLANTGRLTSEEWELMQHHAVWGEQFLAGRSGFDLAARIARSHHERWDGGGYPDGLLGEEIPEAATIVAVADSFDAMTSDRPYKPGRSSAAALQEVMACSGAQFSPKIVQALAQLYKQRKLPRRRTRPVVEEQAA
jgi:diguanylate cyclase (GGDEF)-like protein/PAS domain S-box-containing protein